MNRPLLSVIILSFNKGLYIEQAISSVKDQAHKHNDIEVIVIDDRSTDGTIDVLQTLKDKYGFLLHINKSNMGPSASRNYGVMSSKGKYTAFLDGDDYWLPGRVEKTFAPILSDPTIDVVVADALINEGGELSKKKQSDLMPLPDRNSNVLDHLFKRNFINMCSVTMKTKLAQEVLFDNSLRSGEDYDFWLRVAASDPEFYFIREPLVAYRLYENNLSGSRLLSIDSTLQLLEKNAALARTKIAKQNLKMHRQSLFEDRLKVRNSDILESLQGLALHRDLGKRELAIRAATRINRRAGEHIRRRLMK